MMRLIYTLSLGFISKTFGSLKITPSAGADPGFVYQRGCTRLLLCFNTNKPHSFFFLQNASCIRKPQVILGRGGGAHPLHPPSRSAPALSLLFNIKTISCLTVPRIYPFRLKFRIGLLCEIGYCGTRPAERYKIATDRKRGLLRSMAESHPAITSDWM